MAFEEAGIQIEFTGEGLVELTRVVGVDETVFEKRVGASYSRQFNDRIRSGDNVVVRVLPPSIFAPRKYRLLGDPSKANSRSGWQPECDLKGLVEDMALHDLEVTRRQMLRREEASVSLHE